MTTTLKHMLPDGSVATRRTEHDYGYVRVKRYRVEGAPRCHVVGWHKTAAAAQRARRSDQFVEAVNGGERHAGLLWEGAT